MADPFFSVVIPAYNREKFICPAVDSVLEQTFEDFEVIVVDDASTDKTAELVQQYEDPRVRLVQQLTNQERGAARNAGVESAKGKYICYLDSDDRFLPDHLSNFYNYISKDDFPDKLWFANTYLETKNSTTERPQPNWDESNKFGYILRYTFTPCRVCVSKKVAIEVPYDVEIPGIEDMDNWLRIALKYPIVQLKEFTSVYVEHESSYTTGDPKRFEKELKFFKHVFAKAELCNVLPRREKHFLFSKCHYHLAIGSFHKGAKWQTIRHCIKALTYFPSGYNSNANKTMFVMTLYSIPLLGEVIKFFARTLKK